MDSQYSGSLVGDDNRESSMESHDEDDNSIATEERDENSSQEEESSVTTENSSDEEIDPWTTLINDAAFKVRDQYEHLASASHGGTRRKRNERGSLCANSTCISKGIGRCLHEQSGMDESIEKRSHPQKDHGDQRRLCEERYV